MAVRPSAGRASAHCSSDADAIAIDEHSLGFGVVARFAPTTPVPVANARAPREAVGPAQALAGAPAGAVHKELDASTTLPSLPPESPTLGVGTLHACEVLANLRGGCTVVALHPSASGEAGATMAMATAASTALIGTDVVPACGTVADPAAARGAAPVMVPPPKLPDNTNVPPAPVNEPLKDALAHQVVADPPHPPPDPTMADTTTHASASGPQEAPTVAGVRAPEVELEASMATTFEELNNELTPSGPHVPVGDTIAVAVEPIVVDRVPAVDPQLGAVVGTEHETVTARTEEPD